MLSNTASALTALSLFSLAHLAVASEVHGAGAEGTTMGPVAFMWPSDRPWSATQDNIGPCGSSEGVGNRTDFPLGAGGSVAFSIADDAYNVALRIAFGNNPTTQAEFQAIKGNVSQITSGHQCYAVPTPPTTVVAGSNATIQLEYWANDSNKNESFFACADIKFVEAALFTTQIPCFNVTATEFTPAGSTPSPTAIAPAATHAPTVAAAKATGLGIGGIAGAVVGSIVGLTLIAIAAFFVVRRKRQSKTDTEALPPMKATTSL